MSYLQNYQTSSPQQPRALTWHEEYDFLRKLEAKAAWYNPATKREKVGDTILEPEMIYLGEDMGSPTWDTPVFSVARYKEGKKLWKEGKISADNLEYDPWEGTEWQEQYKLSRDYQLYGRKWLSDYKQASGVITSVDNSAVNVIQILGELQGRETKQYPITNAVGRINTPNLVVSIDKWEGFSASADVPEAAAAFPKKGRITRVSYEIGKDVGHIMITDEAIARNSRDLFQMHTQHAVQDLNRIKATKVVSSAEGASVTAVSGADWGAITGNISTNDPIAQIGDVADIIEVNGGNASRIITANRAFRDFSTNSHVIGPNGTSSFVGTGSRVIGNIPGLAGFTWTIDNLVTNTLALIFDEAAIAILQGPTRTAQYRKEAEGIDAYITRDFNNTKVIDAGKIRKLTAVSA